ncbi:thymidine phosphorylase [candidate division KSB1 bacterium]|nr:thymidine phosphorylase [candidate division KSB1 bacterium]
MMNIIEIIEKKRDGKTLSKAEFEFIIKQYCSQQFPDYQMAALLMAIYLKGLDFEETVWLTDAMLNSGEKIDLSAVNGIKVDKHSTGGVGDKVSLILGPMVAAAGVPVPMISGRGLGHSGGTLDKLEAIPGFNTNLTPNEFIQELSEIGISFIGQTQTIVPADKKIYALRDSIATVNSIPLVTASIMSKKIAEGTNALVLDVKVGTGAFFKTETEAIELAQNLIAVGKQYNLSTIALLTAMDQPLGFAVGNWLETREALDALRGEGPADLMEITYTLGALMLLSGKRVQTIAEGIKECQRAIKSKMAYNKFLQVVQWQCGDMHVIEHPETYPQSRYALTIKSLHEGYLQMIDAVMLGRISMKLGAGRLRKEDEIDYAAGILLRKKEGDYIQQGEVLAVAYSNQKEKLIEAKNELSAAYKIGPEAPPPAKRILKIIDENGVRDWNYDISNLLNLSHKNSAY